MKQLTIAGIWCVVMLSISACGPSEKRTETTEKSTQDQEPFQGKEKQQKVILFFGNSITAGYGLDPEDAFTADIQDKMDSLGYGYQVVNAGLSGETTAGGLNRIEWVLQTVPDIFVLELGANDGLRGLDLDETRKNLIAIIEKVKATNPKVKILLAGMQVPPNLGASYTTRFRDIFPEVAHETGADLIPFILEGVAGEPDLNQPDGIHPTAEGHDVVAETVWQKLKPMLKKSEAS